jgi:hypothetical protein
MMQLAHQRTTYGHPFSRRSWVFSDAETALHVDVWVSSDGPESARDRFLGEGAGSAGELKFTLGEAIGDCCVVCEDGARRDLLWLSGARVFRLSQEGGDVDLSGLAKWLETAAPEGAAPPVLRAATPSRQRVAIGDIVQLELDGDGHLPVQIFGAHPVLKLVGGDARHLTLRATASGAAQLSVIVSDPETLLSSLVKTTVEVA